MRDEVRTLALARKHATGIVSYQFFYEPSANFAEQLRNLLRQDFAHELSAEEGIEVVQATDEMAIRARLHLTAVRNVLKDERPSRDADADLLYRLIWAARDWEFRLAAAQPDRDDLQYVLLYEDTFPLQKNDGCYICSLRGIYFNNRAQAKAVVKYFHEFPPLPLDQMSIALGGKRRFFAAVALSHEALHARPRYADGALTTLVQSIGEKAEAMTLQVATAVELVVIGSVVALDGQRFDVTPAQARALQTLLEARGTYVPGHLLDVGKKPSRVMAKLPDEIASLVESNTGAGYRIVGVSFRPRQDRDTVTDTNRDIRVRSEREFF